MSFLPPIPLDREAGHSLQHQLAAGLRGLVRDGRLAGGARVPSTRALAHDLGVSRNTVLYAYEQLEAEGYFSGRHGAGTFVVRGLLRQPATRPAGLSTEQVPVLSDRLQPVAGQELGGPSAGPSTAFAVGYPDPRQFPRSAFARIAARTMRDAPPGLLDYGDPKGLLALREAIADYVGSSRGVRCSPGQVLVVQGSQQALDLISRVLLNPGDPVWLEEPGYHGARVAFRLAGAEVIPVPLDCEGIDVVRGKTLPVPRLISVTPSNQFPTCVTMSLERRLALLEFAREHQAWIVEDDYDSEFRYSAAPIPALQGLDEDGRVLYVGTFSKTLSPALRIGYIVLPMSLVETFAQVRSMVDQSSSPLLQSMLAQFLAEGQFSLHLSRMRRLYGRRQQFLADGLHERFEGALQPRPANGGLHLCVDLMMETTDTALAARLGDRGVRTVPMSLFHIESNPGPALLLGYAGFNEGELAAGLDVLQEELDLS